MRDQAVLPQIQFEEEEFYIRELYNVMGHSSQMAVSYFWKHTRVNMTRGLNLGELEMCSAHAKIKIHILSNKLEGNQLFRNCTKNSMLLKNGSCENIKN